MDRPGINAQPCIPRPMTAMAIRELVALLRAIESAHFTPAVVGELLADVSILDASLQPYLHWQPKQYTRNLIYRNAVFELLVVCWEPGSCSPVHDHAGQDCWLRVHQGALCIDTFDLVNPSDVGRIGSTIALRKVERLARLEALSVDHRGPANDIHRVINRRAFGARAVSVHIYAKPFDSCVVYDTKRDVAARKTLCYHSVEGLLTGLGQGQRPPYLR